MPEATTPNPRNRHERRVAARDAQLFARYRTIERWCELTDMSRSGTYRALATGQLTAIKLGTRTLIDVEAGLAWLASLPRATFGTGSTSDKSA